MAAESTSAARTLPAKLHEIPLFRLRWYDFHDYSEQYPV